MLMKAIAVLTLVSALLFGLVGTGLAASTPGAGQPNQSCQAEPMTPGNAASARGSAFNASGVAPAHYAGQQPQNSTNPKAVAQYDVACFQVSQPHP